MEFKGTKGNLERKYVGKICIGIGTTGNSSQITANSIIQHIETDEDYEKERVEIESNMLLYSKAPDMLGMLKKVVRMCDMERYPTESELSYISLYIKELIKQATEL